MLVGNLTPSRRNLAYMSVWGVIFVMMQVVSGSQITLARADIMLAQGRMEVDAKVELIRSLIPRRLDHTLPRARATGARQRPWAHCKLGFALIQVGRVRELQERDLSGEDVVALVLDGKTFAEATMVVALGITMTGDKRFLGFVETDTENEQVLTPFLRSLVERGLDVSQGLLVIVDGGKGLRAAVRHAFRHRALVQRCQWHKRENVVSYLAKREQPVWRQRLQRAYNRPEYDEALAESLQHELEDRNQSAAAVWRKAWTRP